MHKIFSKVVGVMDSDGDELRAIRRAIYLWATIGMATISLKVIPLMQSLGLVGRKISPGNWSILLGTLGNFVGMDSSVLCILPTRRIVLLIF